MGAADSGTAPVEGAAWGSPAARWMLTATVLASGMAFLDSTVVGCSAPTGGRCGT